MRSMLLPRPSRRTRDLRLPGILVTAVAVVLGGLWLGQMEPTHAPQAVAAALADPRTHPLEHAEDAREKEVRRQFDGAVSMLRTGRYGPAAVALQRVLKLAPDMPEAHVNMGFALLGLQRPTHARNHFDRSTTLNLNQANAYFGLALAHEARGEFELALGAMRSYLHLARAEDDAHLRRARAALWEWETRVDSARADVKR